jgi:hypothetical protein
MPTYVDEVVQEANSLSGIMDKYSTPLDEAGFGEAEQNAFKLAIADVLAKDTAQKNAMELVRQKTAAQNGAMDAALELIRTSQNAGRAAYGEDDKTVLKEFHVGKEKINTVKVMMTELAYMKGVAIKHQTDLAKNGFTADDIASFDTLSQTLNTADMEQENAKKAQAGATDVRDKAADALQKLIRKVRNVAKVKFRKDEVILNEFSSIIVHHSAAKAQPPQPAAAEQKK